MTMNTDDGLTRGWWGCQTCQARFAPLAGGGEEGRREREADDLLSIGANMVTWVSNAVEGADHWHDEFLEWYKPEQWLGGHRAASAFIAGKVMALHAAHAAQLVALRSIYARAVCDSCLQGHALSLTSEGTWGHTVPYGDKPGCYHRDCDAWQIWNAPGVPPDAEAALEKVREGAVREFLAKEPGGRYRAIPQRCGVWWTFGDDVVSEDVALTEAEARAVANALNALGGKP